MGINDLTPVEKVNNIYLKREDKFKIAGVCGGKARAAYQLITVDKSDRPIVTCGAKMSPQCEIVSAIAQYLGRKCYLFMPSGESSVKDNIKKNSLSEIVIINPYGYTKNIISKARKFAEENDYLYIPFGMELKENIAVNMYQVQNIPAEVKRIIIPIGSGMSFISLITGLQYYGREDVEVIGVSVGKEPSKLIDKYLGGKDIKVKYQIIKSDLKYNEVVENNFLFNEIEVDPIYEAKCLKYIEDGDLFWIVGKRL